MTKLDSKWITLSSRVVYKNSHICVVEDEIVKPDGSKGIYGYVKMSGTVGIVAVDKDNSIYLCRQERYVFREMSWEIPRGFIEKKETSEQAARRELLEETGLVGGKYLSLGKLRPSIGLLDEEAEIFIAQELTNMGFEDITHEIMEVKKFKFSKVLEMIESGRIKDGVTISAIQKASHFFN